jgi:photosystem II stability/assembly factor-like uncharacterized protein
LSQRLTSLLALSLCLALTVHADSKEKENESKYGEKTFAGIELRPIGPALTSGRIIDLAVDPRDARVWYIATAGGGVWKTTNAGTSFAPIFDDEKSFSIGCVTVDPRDSLVVWVGTGENNSQRSVSMGDGIYKSIDGGKSWKNAGLEKSEHIGKIVVDPRDSNVVYVAAQGPLWAPGGDRGLYKTTDGGKTWKAVLTVSENTGVTDVVLDPTSPDTLYASSYQRRSGVGHLQVDRRREELDEAEGRAAERGHGAHRPRSRAAQPQDRLRHDRVDPESGRLLRLEGRRIVVEETQRQRRPGAVLRRDLRRSE